MCGSILTSRMRFYIWWRKGILTVDDILLYIYKFILLKKSSIKRNFSFHNIQFLLIHIHIYVYI